MGLKDTRVVCSPTRVVGETTTRGELKELKPVKIEHFDTKCPFNCPIPLPQGPQEQQIFHQGSFCLKRASNTELQAVDDYPPFQSVEKTLKSFKADRRGVWIL